MAGLSYDALLQRAKKALPDALSSGERFQIPEADIVVEGKTTILRNFLDIAEAIRRDPTMVLTYLLRELGTAGAQDGRRAVFEGKGRAPPLVEGKVYELMIQDIGKKGDGIANLDRYIIYVPGTAKGAIVKVHIEKIAGSVAFGRVSRE